MYLVMLRGTHRTSGASRINIFCHWRHVQASCVLYIWPEDSLEVLKAVAEQGGYMYEDLPSVQTLACGNLEPAEPPSHAEDPFSLFRCLTATQAMWLRLLEESKRERAGCSVAGMDRCVHRCTGN